MTVAQAAQAQAAQAQAQAQAALNATTPMPMRAATLQPRPSRKRKQTQTPKLPRTTKRRALRLQPRLCHSTLLLRHMQQTRQLMRRLQQTVARPALAAARVVAARADAARQAQRLLPRRPLPLRRALRRGRTGRRWAALRSWRRPALPRRCCRQCCRHHRRLPPVPRCCRRTWLA
jgi:hypothetical protein